MALIIKNARTVDLARQLAAESGESLTEAITHAIEERLARFRGRRTAPDLFEAIMAISNRCAGLPNVDTRSAEASLGYNEDGTFG